MSSKEEVKREFDEFARKIAKLESLAHELDSLNTKGFELDARIIRAKLKDINAIPEVEARIEELKDKIRSSGENKLRSSIKKSLSSKIEEETRLMKKKVMELENKLAKKRNLASKKQLSSKEAGFVKDIPNLERELSRLKKEFEEHIGNKKVKIDSGVGVLVDVKFDDFVNQIKSELTERLKEREIAMNEQLKSDLSLREKFFAKKYRDLVTEFQDRYHKQAEQELNREVKSRFEDEVNKRMNEERRAIVNQLIKENIHRLHSEKLKMVDKMQHDYAERERMAQLKLERESKEKEDEIEKHEELLENVYREKERRLAEIKVKYSQNLKLSKEKISSEIRSVKKKEDMLRKKIALKAKELQSQKRNLEVMKKKINEELYGKLEDIKRKMQRELAENVKRIKEREDSKLSVMLKTREAQLRSNLAKVYRDKAREEIKKKEAQLSRKKEEIEKHVMAHVKSLFK